MTERPVLFNSDMVRAILAGSKTTTLRPATHPLRRAQPGDVLWVREAWRVWSGFGETVVEYRADNTRIVIRNSGFAIQGGMVDIASPLSDFDHAEWSHKHGRRADSWRPSVHMPRHAARLLLTVTDNSVVDINNLTEADARADGFASLADLRAALATLYPGETVFLQIAFTVKATE